MTNAANLEQPSASAFAELEALFAATSLAAIDRDQLKQWRPQGNLWNRLKPLIARQAGVDLRWTEIDGHRLHYWDSGTPNKPVLVLVHGFGASKENWSYLAAILRRDYRVLALDLPGFGSSSFRTECDYRVDTQAERVAQWLTQLGVGKAFIAGSSMGGAIAGLVAARYPAMIDGLCLMNAAGAPATRMSMLEAGVLAGKNYLVADTAMQAQRVFQLCFHSRKRMLGVLFGLLMGKDMAQRSPVNHAIFADLVGSLGTANEALPSIAAPTLVLWGDSDRVLDSSCVDAFLAAIPQARAMVFPETGHLPMVERPQDTATVLKGYFNAALAMETDS